MSLAGFDEAANEDDWDQDAGEEDDDVDGIVDPLAGLRNAEDESDGDEGLPEPADDSEHAVVGEESGFGEGDSGDDWSEMPEEQGRKKQPLDLSGATPIEEGENGEGGTDEPDELLLDADRLAEQDEPVQPAAGGRRRGLVSGSGGEDAGGAPGGDGAGGGSGGSGGGSTLFERMANLSRGSDAKDEEEDDEDEDDGGALNIPRFLGRQNNQ